MTANIFIQYKKSLDDDIKNAFYNDHLSADKLMLVLMYVQLVVAASITSISYGYYMLGIIGGGAITVTCTIGYIFFKGRLICRALMGLGFGLYLAIFIQQQQGLTEAHFHYFFAVAILVRYKDVIPLLVQTVVVGIHHLSFANCQSMGCSLMNDKIMIFQLDVQFQLIIHLITAITSAAIALYIINGNITQFYQLQSKAADIKNLADKTVVTSDQLQSSADHLAASSAEQSASLEEVTATMEQLSAQTKENFQNSTNASELAGKNRDIADKGNQQMQSLLDSITSIKDSSNEISKIATTIGDFAFQSNILALNAAVEAARAGEYGYGFSVVSDEVRSLAQRSSEATTVISNIIEESIKKINNSFDIATVTADTLNEIMDQSTTVSKIMDNVKTSSEEQSNAYEEILRAITQLNDINNQNTSVSQEIADTSDYLTNQYHKLLEMTSSNHNHNSPKSMELGLVKQG